MLALSVAIVALVIAVLILVWAPDDAKPFGIFPLAIVAIFGCDGYGTLTSTQHVADYEVKHRDAGSSDVWIERLGSLRQVRVPLQLWESVKPGDRIKCSWSESGLTGSEFHFKHDPREGSP